MYKQIKSNKSVKLLWVRIEIEIVNSTKYTNNLCTIRDLINQEPSEKKNYFIFSCHPKYELDSVILVYNKDNTHQSLYLYTTMLFVTY